MDLSFRDRLLTRPVAEAMTSPTGILLAGAGAAVVLAAGLPAALAPIAAAAAWGVRVLVAMPANRAQRTDRVDPFQLPEPWRGAVVDAMKAKVRFDQAISSTEEGAIRRRLETIGLRLDDGILEVGRIAQRGAALISARKAVDADAAERELAVVRRDAGQPWAAGSKLERAAEALQAQIDTAQRLDRLIDDARTRLRVLDARLDESVARAIELSVQVDDADDLQVVDSDVDDLVTEMEALRQALEETGTAQQGDTGS